MCLPNHERRILDPAVRYSGGGGGVVVVVTGAVKLAVPILLELLYLNVFLVRLLLVILVVVGL